MLTQAPSNGRLLVAPITAPSKRSQQLPTLDKWQSKRERDKLTAQLEVHKKGEDACDIDTHPLPVFDTNLRWHPISNDPLP